MADLDASIRALTKQISKFGTIPQPTLTPYSGTNDKRSFQSFIREINKIGTSMGWTEADCCRHLPLYLKNEAGAVYDTLPSAVTTDWKTLVDELAKKFGVGESAHNFRRQIQSRRQREGESFIEFGQALADLSEKSYPSAAGFTADMRKKLVIDLFLNGVHANVKEHLRRITTLKSLTEAVQAAQLEQELQDELKREVVVNNIQTTQSWKQQPQNSEATTGELVE